MGGKGIVEVELCMGSSCFARGNAVVLSDIEKYLKDEGLEDKVELIGHLCLSKCTDGPNITIDGISYSALNSAAVLKLISEAVERRL